MRGDVPAATIGQYWHTLRHLRPVQVYGRVWFRLHRPRLVETAAPLLRAQLAPLAAPPRRKPSMTGVSTFCFLNKTATLCWPAGWDAPKHEKIWLYNLHYFDDLNSESAAERTAWHRALIGRWLADNPIGSGTGWEPYPLSLRIVNWIKWSLAGNPLEHEWRDSLANQARWLAARLEWHLLGNHLLANAKALIFAGTFFSGDEAQRWLEQGLSVLKAQLPEQILPDGGHFELSPMYHALVLEDMIDLANLAAAFSGAIPEGAIQTWRDTTKRMIRWLACMSHPDGQIAFFNDAAFGVALPLDELQRYGARCGMHFPPQPAEPLVHLKDSGYVRVGWGDCVAILDIAAVGASYLPGHAHADTLSFELSLGGQRVIVNGGTSQYGADAQRRFERSTAAHSTVEIDGTDSSEVWGGFRVARRARPFDLVIEQEGDGVSVGCSHDGYSRLTGRPTHRRTWRFCGRTLRINDHITGSYRHAVARFHIRPGIAAAIQPDGGALLALDDRRLELRCSAQLCAETSAWHPEFGKSQSGTALAASVPHDGLQTALRW